MDLNPGFSVSGSKDLIYNEVDSKEINVVENGHII